jgi:beta-glucosidase-like glycosyl hydrolase
MYVGVATSAKHFLGDGATLEGIDEGNARVYDF